MCCLLPSVTDSRMVLTFHPLKFIDEVKARPGLYDPDHPMDRSERLCLWKEVGAALFPDWHTYSKATAYDRVLQLQKKWRSFRDAYNRELRIRRSDSSRTRKVYRYFKRMTFLGGFEGEISQGESEEDEEQKLLYPVHELQFKDDNVTATSTLVDEDPVEVATSSKKKSRRKKRKRESSDSIQATEEYEMPMSMFSTDNIVDNDSDSDRLFLLSFAPEMRQLPVHIKMWARAQIASVMQEAVNSQYNGTMPRTMIENGIKRRNPDVLSD